MSFGLRVWDAQGRVTLDNADSAGRYLTTVYVPAMAPHATQYIAVPGMVADKVALVPVDVYGEAVLVERSGSSIYVSIGGYHTTHPAFQVIVLWTK